MTKLDSRKITMQAFYVCIYLIFAFVPQTGFILLPGIAATIVPVVVVFHIYHTGFVGALTSGIAFGLSSFAASYMIGDVSGLFYHIDIALLPRLAMAITIWAIIKALKQHLGTYIFVGILAAFLNTVYVTFFIFLHRQILIWANIDNATFMSGGLASFWIWISMIWISSLFEMIFAGVIATGMYPLVQHLRTKYNQINNLTW